MERVDADRPGLLHPPGTVAVIHVEWRRTFAEMPCSTQQAPSVLPRGKVAEERREV